MSRPDRPSGGSTLVIALLISTVLLVAGLGLLSLKALQYGSQPTLEMAAQATLLAQAGLEEATLKLDKDIGFPPLASPEQHQFTYTEDLFAPDGVRLVGSYRVVVDRKLAGPESFLLVITSTGIVGPEDQPLAMRTVRGEVDLRDPSPTRFRLINYQDLGDI